MKLTFNGESQSITSFEETEISNFAVITGLNGSGKTHLLNAINNGKISIEGTDPSEIIFYNYNDFTIHNSDPGKDSQIQQKQIVYSSKVGSFSQRIAQQRQQALDSFQLITKIGSAQFGEYSFNHIPNFDKLINWSDADYDLYEQKSKNGGQEANFFELLQELNPHQIELFSHLGHIDYKGDARVLIADLRNFKLQSDAILIIRSAGFSKSVIDWENEEMETYFPIYQAAPEKIMMFDPIFNTTESPSVSQGLATFLQITHSLPGFPGGLSLDFFITLRQTAENLFEDIEEHFVKSMDPKTLEMIRAINGKNILDPVGFESGFLNLHEIKVAEKNYQIQKKQNEYAEFERSKGRPAYYLTDEEFLRVYGESPVDSLNRVLNEYDCNGYEFQQSEIYYNWGTDVNNQDIGISLVNKVGKYTTTLEALSSGERTLLALAFTIHKLKKRKVISKLFLMDEIDSALHPSMSKRLINVLYNFFHKELHINMIISTHSPSTVAFAPEKSIYVMKRNGIRRLEASSRDSALKELTAGVPSFSVNYENRRQVFVESKYDAAFYESMYRIFQHNLQTDISLNFIASGDSATDVNGMGKSNCEQVIKITKLLRSTGNKFIWGIIDWDLKDRKPEDGLKILGQGKRYSIENYLLDPLLIAQLMWRDKILTPDFFSLPEETKFFEIVNFGKKELQQIIDAVINKMEPHIKPTDKTQQDYQLVNGYTLELPIWFTNHQGHQLEEKYLKAFPQLSKYKRDKEEALKQAIIDRSIADFPGIAPIDLVDILSQVQEV